MRQVLDQREEIGAIAQRTVLNRRYWAIVGNGANVIAAQEVRIKLSELCYKAIACDVTEDKKHIDLSSEPLVLVCAAGLVGSNADDVGKEVAIYRAHRAAPIVIAARSVAGIRPRWRRSPSRPCTPSSTSCSPPWPGTCSDTRRPSRSTRRRDRCGRRGPRSRRRRAVRPSRSSNGSGRDGRAHVPAVLRRAARGHVRRLARGEHGGAARRRCSATSRAALSLDAYEVEHGTVGTPSHGDRRSHGRAHEGHRGAHPPRRRDQAPGEDRHGRDLAIRRDAAPGAARARGARRRRACATP